MESAAFSATVHDRHGSAVVVLQGELDMRAAPQLDQVLESLVAKGHAAVVLDFAGLSFIDSSGISVLIAAQQGLQARGGHLAIHSARAHARKVFEISGLTELLDVRAEGPEEGFLPG
jgi:anti-anti-sigma factor